MSTPESLHTIPAAAAAPRASRLLPAGSEHEARSAATAAPAAAVAIETPAQAYARGIDDGRAQAAQEAADREAARDQQLASALADIQQQQQTLVKLLDAADAARREQEALLEPTVARLTALGIGQLLSLLAGREQLAGETVRALLAQYPHTLGLQLVLSAADYEACRDVLPAHANTRIDPALGRGEYRLVTGQQTLDVAIARQYDQLCELLRHGNEPAR